MKLIMSLLECLKDFGKKSNMHSIIINKVNKHFFILLNCTMQNWISGLYVPWIGTRQVRFLENHWKWSKIDFRKNDFLDPDRSQGYVCDLAKFKKRGKKIFFFTKFWVIEPQIWKIRTNFSFCSEKVPSHPCPSLKNVLLQRKFYKVSKKISVVSRDDTGKGQNSRNISRDKNRKFLKIFLDHENFFIKVILILDFKYELRFDKNFTI